MKRCYMNKSSKLTEGALLTAVYIVILLFFVFVPLVGAIGIFLLSVPFVMYTERYGAGEGAFNFMAPSVMTFIFAIVVSVPITILVGISGIVIGKAMQRSLKPYEIWARGTIGYVVGIVILLLFIQFVLQVNIFEQFDVATEDTLNMMQSMAS